MSCRNPLVRFAPLLLAAGFLACAFGSLSGAAEGESAKFALLVGCSDYQHLKGANLRGPKNDVRELGAALQKEFGFAAANIKQLVGWAKDDKDALLRPTRTNILRELDQLAVAAEKSGEGTQIVIAFSGHGTRVPLPENQHPFDPKNPEPDGLDEAFVAADAQLVGGEMKNLILDNELGEKLQAIRATGAHIWAIFDCCHSGTLARGAGPDDEGEDSRELTPEQLGIAADAVKKAEAKAAAAVAEQAKVPAAELTIFDTPAEEVPTRGSLVAFYAAQPFEKAPDLACPASAPKIDSNYFGLLTYSTLQSLLRERSGHKLTYRELGQTIIGRYRAERGTRGPTPNFGGDLDREVLGFRTWPGRSQILLQKNDTKWEINAGELQGLAKGSVLAIYPPATKAKGEDEPLGYVRVANSTPTSAEVETCEYNGIAALGPTKLQEAMRSEIISRQMGDLRLKVHVPESDDATLTAMSQRTLKGLKELESLVDFTADKSAPWQLRAVSALESGQQFGIRRVSPQLLLIRRGEESMTAREEPLADRVWRHYEPDEPKAIAAIADDLRKIFTWQNLWRVAGLGTELASPNCEVKVELAKIGGFDDTSGGELLTTPELKTGDYLELRIANEGVDRVWVTLVLLDADFSVTVKDTQQLNRPNEIDSALEPIRFRVQAKQRGPQSVLVIATSAETKLLEKPDYSFLTQTALGATTKPVIDTTRASNSPFETFALAVGGQQGQFRGDVPASPQNPALVLRSWTTSPK